MRYRTSRPWPNSYRATRLAAGLASAPRNTPVEIIDKLNKEIDAGVADPKMKARGVGSDALAEEQPANA
jgi:hypothetical protein